MPIHGQSFRLPKAGNTEAEYEDAAHYDLELLRFAMADGASESSFAQRWADSLVRRFVASPPFGSDLSLVEWLRPLQQEWYAAIDWPQLSWFAEEKARAGAFATLLGVELALAAPPGNSNFAGRWRAWAVGDSCLFHVRAEQLVTAFPLECAEAFNNSPSLLCSQAAHNRKLEDCIQSVSGEFLSDDILFLATDALAQWILKQSEAGGKPWAALRGLKSESAFAAFIASLRHEHLIRNDDTTLLIISSSAEELTNS